MSPLSINSNLQSEVMEQAEFKEISNLWFIKEINQSTILELRAIHPKDPIITKRYKRQSYSSEEALKSAFEQDALYLNTKGYNIYVVMNPIKESALSRSASDDDISHRELLLIDIDRAHTAKEPANQAELDAAFTLANEIKEYLKDGGWDDPVMAMSGNGYHLYYKLNMVPNNKDSKQAIEDFLKAMAAKFDNNIVRIDTAVFNASRITKVVGTLARKGAESIDRPYRMARVVPC